MSKNLPVGKPEVSIDDDKYVPGLDDRIGVKRNGTNSHPFNSDFKVRNTSGSQYHDLSAGSGERFNDSEKESHIKELDSRIKEGQSLRHWTGTKVKSEESRGHTGNSAYCSEPIPETFKSATTEDDPAPNAVIYNEIRKDRNTD